MITLSANIIKKFNTPVKFPRKFFLKLQKTNSRLLKV